MNGYFQLAANVSRLSDCRIRVGAVIVKKKPLIACCNKQITHPKYVTGDDYRNSIHAEVNCCLHLSDEQTDNSVIYVYREAKKSPNSLYYPALARPCVFCMEVLKSKGIKKVFYSISEEPYFSWERIA